jgi:hypothetical protein
MEQDRSARDLEREKEGVGVKEAPAARPAQADAQDKAVVRKAARGKDRDRDNAEKTNQKHLKIRTSNKNKKHGGVIMPGFDRTGPFGAGQKTGGARGFCNSATRGYPAAFFGGAGVGRGRGLGRGFRGGMGQAMRGGFGRGYGWNAYAYASPSPYAMDSAGELDMLKAQAESFKKALDAINKRMAGLEKTL